MIKQALFTSLLLIGTLPIWSQSFIEMNRELRESKTGIPAWSGPSEFEETEIPAKWQDEDVVVIARKEQRVEGSEIAYFDGVKSRQRIRLKVLSKAGVAAMSSFPLSRAVRSGWVRIISPNGQEQEFTLNNLLSTGGSSSRPGIIRGTSQLVALPAVEQGCIIDFFFNNWNVLSREMPYGDFFNFPTLYSEREFVVQKQTRICMPPHTFDAVEYELLDRYGVPTSNHKDVESQRLRLIRKDYGPNTLQKWSAPPTMLPYSEVTYRYVAEGKNDDRPYGAPPYVIRTEGPTAAEAAEQLLQFSKENSSGAFNLRDAISAIRQGNKDLAQTPQGNWNDEQKQRAFHTVSQWIQVTNAVSDKEKAMTYITGPATPAYMSQQLGMGFAPGQYRDRTVKRATDWDACAIMLELAEDLGVEATMLGWQANYLPPISDYPSPKHLRPGVQFTFGDGTEAFFVEPSFYQDFGKLTTIAMGAQCVRIQNFNAGPKAWTAEFGQFPIGTADQNLRALKVQLTQEIGSKETSATVTETLSGQAEQYLGSQVLALTDWANELRKTFDVRAKDIEEEFSRNLTPDQVRSQIAANRKTEYEKRLEAFKPTSDVASEVLNNGFDANQAIEVQYSFTTESMVAPLGPDLTVALAPMIATCYGETAMDTERQGDIYLGPFKRLMVLDLPLPEGYEWANQADLQQDISNESGFLSVNGALTPENVLHLEIEVGNHHITYSEDQWPLLLAWSQALSELSDQRIILTKKL